MAIFAKHIEYCGEGCIELSSSSGLIRTARVTSMVEFFGPEVVNKIKASDTPVEIELSMRIVEQPEGEVWSTG